MAYWGRIYDKLQAIYDETGLKFVVDSVFCGQSFPFLIKSGQDQFTADRGCRNHRERIENISKKRHATSMHQSVEWGMRAVESSFPRLKDTMVYEVYGERRITMKMLLLLYNLRARLVGINQIRNVYMPALNVDANITFAGNFGPNYF